MKKKNVPQRHWALGNNAFFFPFLRWHYRLVFLHWILPVWTECANIIRYVVLTKSRVKIPEAINEQLFLAGALGTDYNSRNKSKLKDSIHISWWEPVTMFPLKPLLIFSIPCVLIIFWLRKRTQKFCSGTEPICWVNSVFRLDFCSSPYGEEEFVSLIFVITTLSGHYIITKKHMVEGGCRKGRNYKRETGLWWCCSLEGMTLHLSSKYIQL